MSKSPRHWNTRVNVDFGRIKEKFIFKLSGDSHIKRKGGRYWTRSYFLHKWIQRWISLLERFLRHHETFRIFHTSRRCKNICRPFLTFHWWGNCQNISRQGSLIAQRVVKTTQNSQSSTTPKNQWKAAKSIENMGVIRGKNPSTWQAICNAKGFCWSKIKAD